MAINLYKTLSEFESISNPKSKVEAINQFVWSVRHYNSGQYLDLAQEAVDISKSLDSDEESDYLKAMANLNLGNCQWRLGKPDEALLTITKSLDQFKEIQNPGKAAFAHSIIANLHSTKGDYEEAFSEIKKAFILLEGVENEEEIIGLAYLSMGSFNFDLEAYDEALDYFLRSFAEFSKIEDKLGMARATNNAGTALNKFGRYEEALEYCFQSLSLYEELEQMPGQAKALRDIGKIYQSLKDFPKALDYYSKSLVLSEQNYLLKSASADGIITCLMDIGQLLNHMEKPDEALTYLHKALEISEKFKALPKVYRVHKRLYYSYKQLGDSINALDHLERFFVVRQEVLGQETANKIKMMQTRYALETSQKEALMEKRNNEKLVKAYDEIRQKNKNITDSLLYAKRIQSAIVPKEENLKNSFTDFFILYRPKDIVSGDFVWFTQKNGFKLLAVADSTGHGVPGAFMSLIGHSLLNQIVNEKSTLEPHKILNNLNKAIRESLRSGSTNENERFVDGMDVALVVFDPAMRNCYFSGAKRNFYSVINQNLTEIKGFPFSIGTESEKNEFSQNNRIPLQELEWIYLFTDGFPDQFGGPNTKKFMVSQLKEVLVKNSHLSGDEQKVILEEVLDRWQGNLKQTDDILLVGIKP